MIIPSHVARMQQEVTVAFAYTVDIEQANNETVCGNYSSEKFEFIVKEVSYLSG